MVACRGFIDIELADRRATDKRRSMARGRTRVCGSGSTQALFVPSVANFKTASTLALDHDFAVKRAQFDLANVTPCRVDFSVLASF